MKLQIMIYIVLIMGTGIVSAFQAEDNKSSSKTIPVEKPPKVKQGNVPQPEITITEGKDRTIKEYYIDGALRAIKIMPNNGFPAYYLIDHKGNGNFVKMGPDMGEDQIVPQWILLEW